MKNIILSFIFLCLFSSSSFAWGPFDVYPDGKGGQAYKWKGGTVSWKYDAGPLSSMVNLNPTKGKTDGIPNEDYCKAKSDPCESLQTLKTCGILLCVEHEITKWTGAELILGAEDGFEKVNTTGLKVLKLTSAGEDINSENYPSWEGKALSNGYGLIIFDADGKILANLGYPDLLGLTVPQPRQDAPYYSGGVLILNGLYIDGQDSAGYADVDEQIFVGSVLHELGHLFGLDHSQPLLGSMASDVRDAPVKPEGIPTMYPIAVSTHQESLHVDDVVGISSLYQNSNFINKFCVIKGEIKNKETGKEVQGVNVIAYANDEDDKYIDERSYVSGVRYDAGTEDGYYELGGIVPDKEYKVVVEGVHEGFRNYTNGVNPFTEPDNPIAPTQEDIGSGSFVLSGTGDTTVVCNIKKTGTKEEIDESKTIIMKEKNLTVPEDEEERSGSSKKGWCMSIGSPYNPALWLSWPVLAGFILFLRKRRFSKKS